MYYKDIPGYEDLKERLLYSVQAGRISHAQLLAGLPGSGALALALAHARYIHCRNRGPKDACGECPSCHKYDALAHPDLHFIYPVAKKKGGSGEDDDAGDEGRGSEGTRSIEYIDAWRKAMKETGGFLSYEEWLDKAGLSGKRGMIYTADAIEIIRNLAYKSVEGSYKILIIWLPEFFQEKTSNRLLKSLEEPPEKTIFLLVSHNREALLPTILSRCQSLNIPAMSPVQTREILVRQLRISGEEASSLAMIAEGDWALARKLYENAGSVSQFFPTFRDWMRFCFKPDYNPNPKEALKLPVIVQITDFFKSLPPEGQKQFLLYAQKMIRNSFIFPVNDGELIKAGREELDFAKNFSRFISKDNVGAFSRAFEDAVYWLSRNGSPQMIFTSLTLSLMELLKQAMAPKA
ncbi:MAG: ATP-binding protein [Bacteroidales bacterium]